MRQIIAKYLIVSNVVAAVLLLVSFEPLSETAEVANEKAVPILKQLHNDHDQQLGYVAHMLATTESQALRTRMVIRIIVVWLLVNAVVSWRCSSRQHQAGQPEPPIPPK